MRYPSWICKECAYKLGYPQMSMLSTYHIGSCGWCKKQTAVTQPRDYGYPPFDEKGKNGNDKSSK